MDELIKLVRTYRLTAGLTERLQLAEEIFGLIEPDLRFFVFGTVPHHTAEDILQEVLKAVATGLDKFRGNTVKEFWAWCYQIARNKLSNQYRKQAGDKMQPMPPEELWQLVDASAQNAPMSAADKHDLDYAMKLLAAAKPECHEYLWKHFIFGLAYDEIAEELKLTYDGVRMKIGRCLGEAQSLMS
jgi:RNA polymerase sigma factor (sigma-70 family)